MARKLARFALWPALSSSAFFGAHFNTMPAQQTPASGEDTLQRSRKIIEAIHFQGDTARRPSAKARYLRNKAEETIRSTNAAVCNVMRQDHVQSVGSGDGSLLTV